VVFTASAASAAALVGFAAGLPFVGLPPPSPVGTAVVAAVAVVLDALGLWRGRPQPPSVRSQVPAAWSDLFVPPVVALLYGARLGVGPLTILPTWLWWAAFGLGAWHGPLPSAGVGIAFALARAVSVLGLGMWVRTQAPRRMARLRAMEQAAAWVVLAVIAAASAVVAQPK
jgi:hypothetical protein